MLFKPLPDRSSYSILMRLLTGVNELAQLPADRSFTVDINFSIFYSYCNQANRLVPF